MGKTGPGTCRRPTPEACQKACPKACRGLPGWPERGLAPRGPAGQSCERPPAFALQAADDLVLFPALETLADPA